MSDYSDDDFSDEEFSDEDDDDVEDDDDDDDDDDLGESSVSESSDDDTPDSKIPADINSFGTSIHKKIQAKLNAKKGDNSGALITEIHPDIMTKYNSVNVIVGKQSLGKTVIALEEIIKISYMNTHHLLIYVTKDGEENDRSWLALKNMIEMPIVLVSEENAQACINELITAKSLYYKIRRERIKNEIAEEQLDILFSVLQVDNFEKPFLHTLILFDDISNSKLFASEESFFSQLLRRCRHNNLSFYLLIQGWKGIKPHIKNEITTLILFPGFNKQQIRYIYGQSASNLDFEDFYQTYARVGTLKRQHPDEHPLLVVQVTDGGDTIIRS